MAARLDTVDGRDKLKPRAAPYWQKISSGCHLGFRRLTPASPGTWIARAYDGATLKQHSRSLGSFDTVAKSKRFDEARRAAEAWFRHLEQGGTPDTVTVRQACEAYVQQVRNARQRTADDIRARYERHVYADKIAGIPLPKLNRIHIEGWRQALAEKPVRINRYAHTARTRPRSLASVNRDVAALRAALNHAHDRGRVTTDMAWRVALRPTKNVDGRRDASLDREQRRALLAAAPADLSLFLRALSLVPLRPGALAALALADFDPRLRVLRIGKDKAGQHRRIKLPEQTAGFFEGLASGRVNPEAPLLIQSNGKAWNKDAWKKPFKTAAASAGLPAEITAYAMRHSVITDLVTAGLDIMTVALLSGTSIEMIEKHYGHLRAEHAAAALATLAL